MSAPDPDFTATPRDLAAALNALAVATTAELREAAAYLGEDGRRDAIEGALSAAAIVARYHAEDTSASAVAYAKRDGDGRAPLREAAALFCESVQADIAAGRAEEALDEMRKAENMTREALAAKRFDYPALLALRERIGA